MSSNTILPNGGHAHMRPPECASRAHVHRQRVLVHGLRSPPLLSVLLVLPAGRIQKTDRRFRLNVQVTGSPAHLPTASTCSYQLSLPPYASKATLRPVFPARPAAGLPPPSCRGRWAALS